MSINLNEYSNFVSNVTSRESNFLKDFIDRLENVKTNDSNINMSLLITSSLGLSSETGEFNEIVKKIIFQGKEMNQDNLFHMKRELGAIIWYWINACRSLHLDPYDVIDENVKKLKARYSKEEFSVQESENRKINDI